MAIKKPLQPTLQEEGANFTVRQHSCPIYSVIYGSVTLGLPYLGEAYFPYTNGLQSQGHLVITHKGKEATVPRTHLLSARHMNYDTLENTVITLKFCHILEATPDPVYE